MINQFGDMVFTVSKDELLRRIRENRSKHREVFEAALEGYRQQAISALEEQIKALAAGKTPVIRINFARPEDHTVDYDAIIDALEMDMEDSFVLPEGVFRQYVRDEWGWKRAFLDTSNSYAAATVEQVYGSNK